MSDNGTVQVVDPVARQAIADLAQTVSKLDDKITSTGTTLNNKIDESTREFRTLIKEQHATQSAENKAIIDRINRPTNWSWLIGIASVGVAIVGLGSAWIAQRIDHETATRVAIAAVTETYQAKVDDLQKELNESQRNLRSQRIDDLESRMNRTDEVVGGDIQELQAYDSYSKSMHATHNERFTRAFEAIDHLRTELQRESQLQFSRVDEVIALLQKEVETMKANRFTAEDGARLESQIQEVSAEQRRRTQKVYSNDQ